MYGVTEDGEVWSYKYKKFLRPAVHRRGYLYVYLSNNNVSTKKYIHRLVAETYIPNPENLDTVDHIDENKLNNNVSNLRWLSRGENKSRSWSKQIRCIETGEVFNSVTNCARSYNLQMSNIWKVINGERNHTGGLSFEYVERD